MSEAQDKLAQFESELRAEHDALTRRFLDTQEAAEAMWAEHEAASRQLTAFRSKYFRVIKALNERQVEIVAAGDVGTVAASDIVKG